MLPIISSMIRNQRFQDLTAIGRGLYRVADGYRDPFKQEMYGSTHLDHSDEQIVRQESKKNVVVEKVENAPTIKEVQPKQTSKTLVVKPVVYQSSTTKEVNNLELEEEEVSQKKTFKENKVPDTPFSRALQFSFIGAKIAGSTFKGVLTGQSWKEAAVNTNNAEYLAQGLCKMRGAPLKLAQALSIQEDKLIPESIRKAFEQARQTADIMPQSQLNKILIQELGTGWREKFDSFDTQPFAAASIGQVHRAVVDGKEVAVKIQYPGVRESIDSDMNNLRRLMQYTNLMPKTMYMDEILDNTRKELYEECDYVTEALKQVRYRNMLQNDTKDYIVPNVYPELSTERILTSEYIEGEDLDYVAKNYPQNIRDELGRKIMSLTMRELFEWKFMQSDPNPSNFSYKKSTDQLVLLDFGAAHEYDKLFVDRYIDIIYGGAHLDREMLLKKSIEIGFLNGQEQLRMKDAHVDSIIIVAEPFMNEGLFDFGQQRMTEKIYELMPTMLKYRLKAPPAEVYSLHRKLSGAYLMNMKLRSKVECRSIFMNLYNKYQRN